MINGRESATPFNIEEELTNMQDLDDTIDMFPEEANDEGLRSAENMPKKQNAGTGIDRLVM